MRAYLLRHGESAHNANTGDEPLADELGDRLTERVSSRREPPPPVCASSASPGS